MVRRQNGKTNRVVDFIWIIVAYSAAMVGAWIVGMMFDGRSGPLSERYRPLLIACIADLAATVVVFGGSVVLGNSSVYDAYWSLAPIAIAGYWASVPSARWQGTLLREAALLLLVVTWGARLTWNWARRWEALKHEDWRYVGLRRQHGGLYWVVSFFGIHLMPTILVYLGCLSLFPVFVDPARSIGPLDLLALLVSGGAIWLEAAADQELREFVFARGHQHSVLCSGVWALCRHPNYLGEILFWWGLYLFGLAANPAYWWAIIGPLSISVLFRWVSIPLVERRLHQRRPGYASYVRRTPMLVPVPRRWRDNG